MIMIKYDYHFKLANVFFSIFSSKKSSFILFGDGSKFMTDHSFDNIQTVLGSVVPGVTKVAVFDLKTQKMNSRNNGSISAKMNCKTTQGPRRRSI